MTLPGCAVYGCLLVANGAKQSNTKYRIRESFCFKSEFMRVTGRVRACTLSQENG